MEEANNEKKDNTVKLSNISFIALIVVLVILLIIVFYLLYQWQQEKSINTKLTEQVTLVEEKNKKLEGQIKVLTNKGNGGEEELTVVINQINQILQNEKSNLMHEGVDAKIVADILANISPGNAKTAVTTAMLLALRKYRFRLGGHSPAYGFDSPEFIRYVLNFADVELPEVSNNRFLSSAIMGQLEKTDSPQAGDLMFFKGSPGNIGLFYLGSGSSAGAGLGIGFLGLNFPCGIYDTSQIESEFLGYYSVKY